MKELKEEQENLEDLVQDKIDSDVNNMFDDQIDKIEEDSDEEVKNLEKTWSESKIAEMVKQALDTGVFTDIDGNIKTLQTALMDFANESSEYFGVMGTSLKKELLDNLNVALETMKELQKISDNYTAPNIDYSNTVLPKDSTINTSPQVSSNVETNNITIGDTNITVQGSADDVTLGKVDEMLKDYKASICKEIVKNMK
nr:MAG TPA: hypothetical protein [Caudoviricetes sp.]